MAYIINRFDGTQLTIVDDGVLDNTTPLGLIGRNYTGYGEVQNENFIFLLENFANQSPPTRSIRGQIWYDTVGKALKVYNGTDWLSIGNATVAETEPGHSSGGLWLKATTKQLYISDGTVWRLVGPEGVEGFSTTKLTSTKLKSTVGTFYPVILSEINGETVAILSGDTFAISPDNTILGFDQLNKGINLKADSSITGSLKGNATSATRFETSRTINDVAFNGTSNIVITATTNQPLSPGDYIIGSDFSGAFADTWNIDASPENLVGKIVARDSTGSFSATTITAGEFTGTLLGNVLTLTGTSTFDQIAANNITGETFSGLAARATRLSARRTINTVPFDGTEDIILPVPAETLTGNTLATNIVNSSLTTLGKLEYLETEAPGIKVGDGNNLLLYIEGFTPTIEAETTDILKLKLKTGAVSASPTTVTFLSASAASADGVVNPALVPDYTLSTDINNRPVLGLPSFRWRNIYSKEATLDGLKTNTISGRTPIDQVTFTKDIIVTGTAYTSVVGNLTGNVTGSSSLNVLKSGDTMTGDLIVGSVTKTSNSLISVRSSDSHRAGFEAYGSNQGTGYLYVGQSTTFGGGVSYNGDNSPSFIPGENADYITFYRRNAGTDVVVFEYPYNSNDVSFKGNVAAVTFSGNGINISNLNAANISTGLLPVARLSGTYNINVAGNLTGNVTGNVTGNLTGSVTGNLTGTVTGSSTLNVLKAGDTMTGDLTIQKSNAWISLDSPSDGTEGTNQAAGISIGESGYKGSATLHMTYTGDGFGHIGMGPINGSTSLPQYEAIRLYYLDNTVRVLGNMTVAGTASGTFSGTGTSLDINAERLVVGNIPVGRLSGTYNISISGNSNYANTAGSAAANIQRTGDTMTGRLGQSVTGFHAASIDNISTRTNSGFFDNPNPTTAKGWPVSGSWHHLLSSTHVNDANYYAMQFSADFYAQNLYYRSTAGNGATAWNKILHSNNYNDYSPTKSGGGATGTWSINITGNSATVSSISSGQVTGALGYVPVNPASLTNQAGSNLTANNLTVSGTIYPSVNGIRFPNDPFGGSGDAASITVESVGGERMRLRFRVTNDAGITTVDDKAEFLVPDNNSLLVNGNVVLNAGNYNSYSPSLAGAGATGTWPINITGNANSVTSISSSQITTALGYVPVNPSTLTNQSGSSASFGSGTFTGDIVSGTTTKTSNTVISVRAGDSYRAGFEAYGSNQGTGYLYVGQSTSYGGGISYNGDGSPGFINGETADKVTFFRRDAGTDYEVFSYWYYGDTVEFNGNVTAPSFTGNLTGNVTGNVSGNAGTVSTLTSGQIISALGFTPANGSGAGNINGDQNYQDYLLRRPTIIDYSLYHNALGNVSGSTTVNLEAGNYVSATAVGAVTWTFSNPPTGSRVGSIIMELTNGGSFTQYWPASVRWPSGVAPTLASSGVDVLVFLTDDAGSNWRGAISMGDSR